jgi:hypothetical protein
VNAGRKSVDLSLPGVWNRTRQPDRDGSGAEIIPIEISCAVPLPVRRYKTFMRNCGNLPAHNSGPCPVSIPVTPQGDSRNYMKIIG